MLTLDKVHKMASILFVGSEMASIHKTGGLGDVMLELPRELRDLGLDITVAIPGYKHLEPIMSDGKIFFEGEVFFRDQKLSFEIVELEANNLRPKVWLIKEISWVSSMQGDDARRFGIIALILDKFIEINPDHFDIVHGNDWHTGILIALLSLRKRRQKRFFTIHNMNFQGSTGNEILQEMKINNFDDLLRWEIQDGNFNYLLEGILHADVVTTVSPNYAKEIMTDEYGCGLNHVLIEKNIRIEGILNGIDMNIWNPELDPHVPFHFNKLNYFDFKPRCKESLQEKLGIAKNKNAITLGYVGRADASQKGIQLILEAIEKYNLMNLNPDLQLIMLADGDEWLENEMNRVCALNERSKSITKFDDPLARCIFSGCDFMLIPSKYEPCGLVQLIAMRYGAIPIVRATGGLKDTVKDLIDGVVFDEYNVESLIGAINRAVEVKKSTEKMNMLISTSMSRDWGWKTSGLAYRKIYGA